MKLCFDSIEEVKDFVKQLKGTRGGKAGDTDGEPTAGAAGGNAAPAPLTPPQGQAFNPGGAAFTPPQGQAFNPGAPLVPSEVATLVQRISTRIDAILASGTQSADTVLTWFRSQVGAEAANATMEQIKTIFLPKTPVPTLENIAKLIAA